MKWLLSAPVLVCSLLCGMDKNEEVNAGGQLWTETVRRMDRDGSVLDRYLERIKAAGESERSELDPEIEREQCRAIEGDKSWWKFLRNEEGKSELQDGFFVEFAPERKGSATITKKGGRMAAKVPDGDDLHFFAMSKDGKYLLCGYEEDLSTYSWEDYSTKKQSWYVISLGKDSNPSE